MTDMQLLADYAAHRSEAAFTTLTQRHVGMVYSAALRQVGDPSAAEEVTQAVFILLASKAGHLSPDTIVSGWLYRTARFISADVLKKQRRRQQREHLAAQMQTTSDDDSMWRGVAPLLDEGMAALAERDRDALVLRFFEGKNLDEVGAALGVEAEAARKRVRRALEKLRAFYGRHGYVVPAAAIGSLLGAKAVHAAPAGLAPAISSNATLAGTALHHATTIALTKSIAMTTLQKTLLATAIAGAVGTGIYQSHRTARLQEQLQTLQAQTQPLAARTDELSREWDEATNKLAAAELENQSLQRELKDLPKLRSELSRWKREALALAESQAAASQQTNDPIESAARSWAAQVRQLRRRLDEAPDKKIPELQFVNDQDWFDAVGEGKILRAEPDFRQALERLRRTAKNKFVPMLQHALAQFTQANDGQLPDNLSQLKPFFELPVDDAILQRYGMLHTGKLSDLSQNELLISEKAPVDEEFDTMVLIGLNVTAVSNAKGWPKSGF